MVRDVIEANNGRFAAAFEQSDATAAAAVYADDAVLLPPETEMVSGRAAIEQFWKSGIQMGIRRVELETIRVDQRDDLAYELGTARVQIEPEGGEPTTLVGKYVVIHRRQPDGSWKWAVDIYNFDAPAG